MIKWLEGNPLGVVLALMGGGLLAISLLLAVVWSFTPSAPPSGPEDGDSALALDVPELDDSEPLDAYAVISERPVFNQSRLPIIEEEQEEVDPDELLAEEEVDAPDVVLAGVIITPSIRMATLRSSEQAESLVAFEGQPLEGDFGSWQVSRIQAREVTLSSGSGEEVQLKLQVHDVTIEAPAELESERSGEPAQPAAQAQDGESDQPLSRAEEIRQRIAQRREELRRAAENNEQDQAQEVDYRTAIQSMVSGSKRKKEEDAQER